MGQCLNSKTASAKDTENSSGDDGGDNVSVHQGADQEDNNGDTGGAKNTSVAVETEKEKPEEVKTTDTTAPTEEKNNNNNQTKEKEPEPVVTEEELQKKKEEELKRSAALQKDREAFDELEIKRLEEEITVHHEEHNKLEQEELEDDLLEERRLEEELMQGQKKLVRVERKEAFLKKKKEEGRRKCLGCFGTKSILEGKELIKCPTCNGRGEIVIRIYDSNVLQREHADIILKMLQAKQKALKPNPCKSPNSKFNVPKGEIILKKLYCATEDGFTGADFHRQVDHQAPTITFIRATDSDDNLFGGFAWMSWADDCDHDNRTRTTDDLEDCWLFSIANSTGKPFKLLWTTQNKKRSRFSLEAQTASKEAHITCHKDKGPMWGLGDLTLSEDMSSNNNYIRPKTFAKSSKDFATHKFTNQSFTKGDVCKDCDVCDGPHVHFNVAEIECFKVLWN